MTEEENIEEETIEERPTVEDLATEQLDFEDPEDDIQQEQLAEYIEEKTAEQSEDLEGDVDDTGNDPEIDTLMDEALEVGLTEDDIDQLGSIENVQNFIEIAKRQMENMQESAQIEQTESQFDQMITDVGSSYSGLFGSGPTAELADESTFLENRVLLIEEMNTLAAGYEASGREVPAEDVLMRKAVASAFTEDRDEIQAAQMRSAINNRRDAFTASPTQRRGRAMTPEAAAKQSVRSYMEQAGLLSGIDDTDL